MIGRVGLGLSLVAGAGIVSAAWMGAPRDRIVSTFATSLEGRSFSQRHNTTLAMKQIDGKVIPPRGVFSFNRAVGSYSRDEGFRKAPVSYNGQLISDWGGGVCQASTTCYNACLLCGLTILERNRHRFCPSYVSPGRDAAVAYPTIDLRVFNPYRFAIGIHAFVDVDKARVDLVAAQPLPSPVRISSKLVIGSRPATYFITGSSNGERVRNSGKQGVEATIVRQIGSREELVSDDCYPVMNRVVERP